MAHYESVNNIARKIVKRYETVNNVARYITKHYECVNNAARLIFSGVDNILTNVLFYTTPKSGGNTALTHTLNETTFNISASSQGDGIEDYDNIYYVISGLVEGDEIEIVYEWYLSVKHSYALAAEYAFFNNTNVGTCWTQNSAGMSPGTHAFTRELVVPAGSTSFCQILEVVGNYEISSSINVTSIKLNGNTVFPV